MNGVERRRWLGRLLSIGGLFAQQAVGAQAPGAALEFFENKVRPVLVNNCGSCHDEAQVSGLRLDSRTGLMKGGSRGPAIVTGDPDNSLLIQAVEQTHEKLKMPPGKKLAEAEISDLRAWVRAGAVWPETKPVQATTSPAITPEQRAFWSFQPLRKSPPPEKNDRHWPKGVIDRFVLAKLEERGLTPVGNASKRALIRRITYDLTGLPPSPQETAAFLSDTSGAAFSHVVDRLLASPRFGERWGRYWLDVARYAEDDTRGIGQESYQNAWRYRDWVVKALNDDMPYDVFVKAQIAGDLLEPKGSHRLRPGLGFIGLGPWYYDMAEPPQARADERHDRVDAVTRGFLGLTVACSRCHNHKYDPITSKDYYALSGVFASSDYVEYPLVGDDVVTAYRDHKKKIVAQEKAIKNYIQTLSDTLADIEAHKTARYLVAAWSVIGPGQKSPPDIAGTCGLDVETLERWVGYLKEPEKDHPYLSNWYAAAGRAATDTEIQKIGDGFQQLVLAVLAEKKEIDEENRFTVGKPKTVSDALANHLPNGFATYDDYCPGCNVEVKAIVRDKFVLWNDLFGKEPSAQPSEKHSKSGAIYLYSGEEIDRWLSGEWKAHLDDLRAELKKLKDSLPPQYPYVHGMGEAAHPLNLRVNLRGSPFNLGEEVPRRFLAVLSDGEPAPFTRGSGRLDLAEAIVRHPLAARVMANRIWEHLFGEGVVRTPSNFGRLGQRPDHPELLDYLASRLVDYGWSVKSLIREIVHSATYQLSSDVSEKQYAVDPENRLLWHMNRRRLDVEAVRDSILADAGTLDQTVGGPSVDLSKDQKRRTIYGRVSRFQLDETLRLFDFPSPSITSEKRNVTQVPLQRLYFLNSDFVMDQAGAVASRLASAVRQEDSKKISWLYELLFTREASQEEIGAGLDFLQRNTGAWPQYIQALMASNQFSFVD